MRPKKPRCGHADCFTCPYDDCIATKADMREKKGPGRPKLFGDMSHQNQLNYAREYYQKHKEKRQKYFKEYYQKNKEAIQKQQKEYRERRAVE